ncbi:MAG: tetratricopeptide (TPR) repeat protein [Myxococcota bacterium]|jgi:tetratricopeptide (TPR) repeat protein
MILLSSVAADPAIERQAAKWSMPVSDARVYLGSSDAGCPSPDSLLPASACLQAPADRGLSAEQPLAWGAAGAADPLWFGRLRCRSGATPQAVSEAGGTWRVQCPGDLAAVRWHVDATSCGSPCPPVGVEVMAADAANLERQVSAALVEERTGDALHLAGMSISRFPQYASTWRLAGLARAATGDHAGALEAFEAAEAIDPADSRAAYYAVRAAHSAGRWEAARDRAERLAPSLGADPVLQADVRCVEAIARIRLGDAQGAPQAAAACAAGAPGCCGEAAP